jgi:chromate transport protein ChrA
VALSEKGLPLLTDYPDLRIPRMVRFYPTLALVTVAAWLILMVVYLRTCRATFSDRVRRTTYAGIIIGTLALHLALLVSFVTRFMRPDAASTFWRVLVGRAGLLLPDEEATVWLICALVFAGAYWLAQREFERTEMPAPTK